MLNPILLPLTLLFTNPECARIAHFAEIVALSREVGVPRESLTAIPILALLSERIPLPSTITIIAEISHFYALPIPSWEVRMVEYERCLRKEEEQGNGRGRIAIGG